MDSCAKSQYDDGWGVGLTDGRWSVDTSAYPARSNRGVPSVMDAESLAETSPWWDGWLAGYEEGRRDALAVEKRVGPFADAISSGREES